MSADSQSLDESTDLLVTNVELSGRTEASAEKFERRSNTGDKKNIANASESTWGEERAGVSERLIAGSRTLDDVTTEFVFEEGTKSEINEVPRKQQFETSPRLGSFNKYPPLFFTFNDFENVISSIASFPAEEPRKSTVTIEEIPAEESELFEVCRKSDSDRPMGEVEGSREKSFVDESLEEEGEFHFRVTTTDLPFERCHERWDNRSFGDAFLEGINDRNQYIFDDYMDRSNRVNIARSTRTMWYDIGDNSSDCKPRVNTKVRFVIESPSSSTPEGEFTPDTDFTMQSDSLQNIDSLLADEDEKTGQGGNSRAESAPPDKFCDQTESRSVSTVSDEFGEIPFSSWLEAGNNKNCMVDAIEDDSASSPMFVEIKQEATYGQEPQCGSISTREGFQVNSKQSSDNNFVTHTESTNYFPDINFSPNFTSIEKLIDSSKGKENSRISSATEGDNSKSNTQQNTAQPVTNKYFTDLTNFWNTSVNCDEDFGPTVKTSSFNIQNEATSLEAPDVATENDVTLIHPTDDPRMNRNDSTDSEPNACKLFANLRSSLDLPAANESDLNSSPWARDSADFEPERSWESSLSNSSVTNERKLVERAGKPESVRSLNIAEGEHCASGSHSPTALEKRRIFVDGSQGNVVSNDRGDADWKSPPSQRKKEPAVESGSEISTRKASDIGSGEARANNSTSKLNVGRINSEREESFDAVERVEPRNDPGKKPVNSSVPVDVRRNSFLETMLSDDVQGGSTLLPAHCTVIATHPKIGNGQGPSTEDKAGRKCRPVVPRKPVQPKTNRFIGQAGKKSAGETKNEVLNEVLTNVGSIILKNVEGVENDAEREISAHSRTEDNVASEACRSIRQSTSPKSESIYSEVTNERRSLESCDFLVCEKNDAAKEDKVEPTKVTAVNHRTDIVEDKRATVAVDASVSQNEIYVSRIMQEIEDNVRLEVETCQQKVKVNRRSRGVRGRSDNNKKTEEAERRMADDDDNDDDVDDDDEGRGRRLELGTTSDSSSGYKCAIARETPHAQCNNNDNNRAVTTPVDLSNDQYRNETVRIVPGSVRNIVKYYEICGETTQASEHSKVRHNKPIDRPRTNARGPSSNPAGTKCQNCSSDPSSMLSVETISSPRVHDFSPGGNDIEYTVIARNLKNERECEDTGEGRISHEEVRGKRFGQFGSEARADPGSGRTSGKFVSAETRVEARGHSTGDGSEVGEEPTIRISEDGQKTDLPLNSPQRSRSGQQNHTVAERAEQSGISRFVPKPETPRLVFYYAL